MKLRWPRGRYNGKRIVGITLSAEIDVMFWHLSWSWNFGEPYVFIGPVNFRAKLVFD